MFKFHTITQLLSSIKSCFVIYIGDTLLRYDVHHGLVNCLVGVYFLLSGT